MSTEHSDAQIFSLRLPAELDQLPVFLDHVRQAAEAAGLAEAQGTRLELAVEEALVNVFNYAYAGQDHSGAVTCRVVVEADGLTVEIVDEGPPFDPLVRPDPDTALELEQRQPGGLGIFMIRQLTDEVSYRREEGRNVLTIRMRKGIE
jgi:anti-sigma regulatory factor (Ser/Thr protein kinase)